jgi:hypothetical protein
MITTTEGRNGSWLITAQDGPYQVTIRTVAWDDKERKTRVYVYGEDDVDFTEANAAEKAALDRDGHWPRRGDYPDTDKMFDRLNRQVVKNKKNLIAEVGEHIEHVAGLLDGRKLNFSRKAGCSCPCSPGFITDTYLYTAVAGQRRRINSIAIERTVA